MFKPDGMLEERYGKFTLLKFKLSRLSYTAVEYFPFSIVISISKYDSWVPHSVVFFSWSSLHGVYICLLLLNEM